MLTEKLREVIRSGFELDEQVTFSELRSAAWMKTLAERGKLRVAHRQEVVGGDPERLGLGPRGKVAVHEVELPRIPAQGIQNVFLVLTLHPGQGEHPLDKAGRFAGVQVEPGKHEQGLKHHERRHDQGHRAPGCSLKERPYPIPHRVARRLIGRKQIDDEVGIE